jgi:hypothetical protein
MRDNPFLGQYTLKSQETRKWREIMMESGKYGREWYDGSFPSMVSQKGIGGDVVSLSDSISMQPKGLET